MCGFCEISFKCSINQLLEYRDLKKFIAAKLLTNFTFALQRIPEWQFLIIFCYTDLLLPRHFESDLTLISFRISRYRISHSSQLHGYRDLTTAIAARLLTNYTFALWRISGWQSLIIFCYIKLPRNSEFEQTLILFLSFLFSHSLFSLSFL